MKIKNHVSLRMLAKLGNCIFSHSRYFVIVASIVLWGSTMICYAEDNTEPTTVNNSFPETYRRLSISYNMITFSPNDDAGEYGDEDKTRHHGFGLGGFYAYKITKKMPIYGEIGLQLRCGWYSGEGEVENPIHDLRYKVQSQNLSISIPINFTYKFAINDVTSFYPYIGIISKFNCLTRTKREWNESDLKKLSFDMPNDGEWVNHLSPKDENGHSTSEGQWNVYQLGWNIGANLHINQIFFGVSFGTDFIPAFKKDDARVNSSTFAISIGNYF